MRKISNILFFCLILMFAYSDLTFAAVQAWKIIPSESKLTFTATQNGAPVSGQFKSFTADIAFDPSQLEASHLKVVVDIGSVTTSYGELTTTLITPEWFNAAKFPQASYEATKFKKIGENKYEADGQLSIRDKSLPMKLTFTGEDFAKSTMVVNGEGFLNRSAFNIGEGEWASTDEIKDEVKIGFKVTAVKQ